MAFESLGRGRFTLAPNASVGIAFWFGLDGLNNTGADDRGAQWAMAQPELFEGTFPLHGLHELAVSDFSKRGYWSAETGQFYYGWHVVVTNKTSQTTPFSLTGGGNV